MVCLFVFPTYAHRLIAFFPVLLPCLGVFTPLLCGKLLVQSFCEVFLGTCGFAVMECPAAVSGEVVRLLFQQSDQNPFWAGELPPEGNHSSNIKSEELQKYM